MKNEIKIFEQNNIRSVFDAKITGLSNPASSFIFKTIN